MTNSAALKNKLMDELWLPKAKEAATLFYPKHKRNIKMRMFTLSAGTSFDDITKFESEKLISRSDIVVWIISDFVKRMRVEAENVGAICEGDILSDSIHESSSQLYDKYPCDIINLDFSTQESNNSAERIKMEIVCLEKHIHLLNKKGSQCFALFFTNVLDSIPVDVNGIVQTSNAISVQGWSGLTLSSISHNVTDKNELKGLLEVSATQMCQKYGYQNVTITSQLLDITGCQDKLFSMAMVVKR